MLRYRLLGPLSVQRDGAELDLGPPKQRAVLAALAHEAGRPVSIDRLLDSVWGDHHPASVQSSLHANISRLRRLLRDDGSAPPPIVRRGASYLLDVERAEVDVGRFLDEAHRATVAIDHRDWTVAVDAGEHALGMWRGNYLEDLRDEEWVRVAAAALSERRSGAMQSLVVGLLGVGDIASALALSTVTVAEQPLVERVAWLHMIALHRAGRTAEALETYRTVATRLDTELGLDAGPALRDLQGAILRHDPEPLWWPEEAAPAAGPAGNHPPGVVEPAAALRPAPSTLPPRTSRADPTAFVGRSVELDAVDACLRGARSDGARWLVLTGPAGIGKTRLAEEAKARWGDGGGLVVRGQCLDLDDVPAWWPVRQLLRDLGADPDAVLAPVQGGHVDAARFAVFEHAADVVRRRLAEQPVMIIVDDIHWADGASLTFLTVLAETVNSPGLAVVLTSRHTQGGPELDRLLAAVARRPDSRQLALSALAVPDVARLIEQVSGERPTEAEAVGLTERTAGTPFYVLEYARLPRDERQGDLIPSVVRTVLRRRFAALPVDVLETLQVAAVLGEPLDVQLLASVLGRDATEIGDLLDAAADLDVLSSSVDSAAYVFTHALLRDELAAAIAELRRCRLHVRAADVLVGAGTLDDLLRRARHLHAAGPLADPAVAYATFCAAATAAEHQWLSETAATWWGAALAAFDRLAHTDEGERDGLVAAQVRAMAWAGQGQSLLDALDAALVDALRANRTGSVGRLAANLLRVSGSWPWPIYGSDPAPLMITLSGLDSALVADPGARARVLAVTAIGRCYDPDPRVPDDLSRRSIELAEQTRDVDVLADALLGRALTYSGVASRAEESIALLDRLEGLAHESAAGDAVLRHGLMSMALINLGRTQECAEHVQAGALGADLLRMPINRVQLRWAEASLAQWHGDLRRATELYERAELAHRRTDLQQTGTFELADLVLLWDQGRLDELSGPVPTNPTVSTWTTAVADAAAGRPGGNEALAAEVRRPEPEVWTSHGRLALLAHCVADRSLVDLAAPLLAAMQPVRGCLASFGQVGTIGPVALAMARLARLDGDHAAAHDHLVAATELARRAGGKGALVHCRFEAAAWAAATGPLSSDRRQEIAAIAREADERGMSGVARKARTLLLA